MGFRLVNFIVSLYHFSVRVAHVLRLICKYQAVPTRTFQEFSKSTICISHAGFYIGFAHLIHVFSTRQQCTNLLSIRLDQRTSLFTE
jgi:hypothetical protein